MASPNLPEFDGDNLRIILPAGITEINVGSDLYSQWKEWQLLGDNAKYPPAFRTIGGDPLTPGINAGAYYFLQNQDGWRIRPPEEDTTIFIEGNLAPEDSTLGVVVPTLGTFRVLIVGLQPITQNVEDLLTGQQDAEYGDRVFIDTVDGGVAGTTYPVGTAASPVNNFADAWAIAQSRDLHHFILRGHIDLDRATGRNFIEGDGTLASVNINGQDVSGTHFKRVGIFGTIGTPGSSPENLLLIEESTVAAPLTGFRGTMTDCVVQAQVTLRSGVTRLYNTVSGTAGLVAGGIIDANGQSDIDLVVRGWKGAIEFRNFTSSPGATISLGLDHGRITVGASCTNFADFQIRGIGHLTNNSAIYHGIEQTIDTSGFLEGEDLKFVRALTAGDVDVSLDDRTVTVYEANDFPESPRRVLAVYDISADGRIRTRTA